MLKDSRFLMGSMSAAVGEKLTLAIEYAGNQAAPRTSVRRQRRARMQEGLVPDADGKDQRGAGPVL